MEIRFSVYLQLLKECLGCLFHVFTFNRLKKGSRHWWYFTIFVIFAKISLKNYQLWPNRTNRADWKFGYLFFATLLGVSEVFISLHNCRNEELHYLKSSKKDPDIGDFCRFSRFSLKIYQLWPHRTFRASWNFRFLFFATPLGVS